MKAKLKYYKNIKREQEHDLDMKNQDFKMNGKCLLLQAKIQNYSFGN